MRKRLAVALACALTGLTACSGPTASDRLPSDITIAVYQSRLDASERKFEIAVTNSSDTDLLVTRLELATPAFASPMEYDRVPTTVGAGRTIDFRVPLAPPNCAATSTTPTVTIQYEHRGERGHAIVEPIDRFTQLPSITTQDCLAHDTERIAHLAFADAPVQRATIAGRDAALLVLEIEPTGIAETLQLHTIGDTPLLSLLNPDTGGISEELPLARTVTGTDAASIITIAVVQSRCDQHSVADDKKGTHFPLTVTTPARAGTLTIQTNEKTRSELFAYLADICGWG